METKVVMQSARSSRRNFLRAAALGAAGFSGLGMLSPIAAAAEAQVVGWIKCAAMIAGLDPVEKGFLAPDGKTLPLPRWSEGFVVHLADHDWVLSVPACQWTVEALKSLARDAWGIDAAKSPREFNAIRNYVLANLTAMRLHAIRSAEGDVAFAADVARIIRA
ncbi:hypothetical protein [Sutterella sp.]|uniref:hypothetical protein n=1 Tax=Sutterella sp. TaxID=1981025 RepID=UPI0026E0586B|nr:hypothetical protein [Sutterella sp.]MDO5532231.1 hypothetical protein [Sutterella sp.]